MLREIVEPNRPITEEDIAALESRLGLQLPPAYRDFLRKYNGGQPVPADFPIAGIPNNPFGAVQAFFGIGANIFTEDIEGVKADLPNTVPIKLIPIACTDGYDFVCLDLRQPGAPVVYWDRVPFWGNEVWNEGDLYPIAPSFEAFLEALHDPDTIH
jgi:hypothetical protein